MCKVLKTIQTFALILLLFTILPPSLSVAQNENYGDRIIACIQPNVSFPTPPRKDSQNPTAQYRVKLNANGTISNVDLTKSSGNSGFDAAVQKGIFACRQFPKPAQRDYPTYIEIAYNMYSDTNTVQQSQDNSAMRREAEQRAKETAAKKYAAEAEALARGRKKSQLPACPEITFPNTCFGTYSDSGYTYIGEWRQSKSHGLGTITLRDEGTFAGYWVDGDGTSGVMTYANGRKVIGTLKNVTFYALSSTTTSPTATNSTMPLRSANFSNQNELENEWWSIKKKILTASSNGNELASAKFQKEMDAFTNSLQLINHVEKWQCEVKKVRAYIYGGLCPSDSKHLAAIECESQIKPDIGYYKSQMHSRFELCITQAEIDLDTISRGQTIVFSGSFKNSERDCTSNCSGFVKESNGIRLHLKNTKLLGTVKVNN